MKFARKARRRAGIDLTPMLDVVFLLLIFFMVSTRFERLREVPIDLPKTGQGEARGAAASARVQIRADGALVLDGRVVEEDQLPERLEAEGRVVISADRRVPHGDFMRVLTRLRTLPLASVTVEVEED